MFGYIKINKPQLKICDYQVYKGIYCSLCKDIGKSFGLIPRLLLSYDFTFLALLKMSTINNKSNFKCSRCSFNPFHKCLQCDLGDEPIKFSSAMSILMLYYKMKDNIRDSKFIKKLLCYLVYPILKIHYNKVKKIYSNLDEYVSKQMESQNIVEDRDSNNFDEASQSTANMLAYIFSYNVEDESQKRILNHLGYCFGRYIYIIDAMDDLKKDIKNHNYNTISIMFKNQCNEKEIVEYIDGVLNRTISEIINTYQLLDIYNYKEIMDNIILEGLLVEKERVLKREVTS